MRLSERRHTQANTLTPSIKINCCCPMQAAFCSSAPARYTFAISKTRRFFTSCGTSSTNRRWAVVFYKEFLSSKLICIELDLVEKCRKASQTNLTHAVREHESHMIFHLSHHRQRVIEFVLGFSAKSYFDQK